MPLGKRNELYFLTSSYSLAESNFNRTGTQVFGIVRYSVRYSVLGILVMANADGVRGVSGRNCSAVCCVYNSPYGKIQKPECYKADFLDLVHFAGSLKAEPISKL